MKKIRSVLVLPDMHVPEEDRRTVSAVEKFIGDHEWDEVINLGDFLDLSCISSHNLNNLREVEGTTLQKDYDYANKVLDRQQALIGNAKYTLLEGNHEFRAERLIDAQPRLRGIVEVEKGLRLKERGINWVRSWSKGRVYHVGKAAFVHGIYTNDMHAKQHAIRYGEPIMYGHTHDIQAYSLTRNGDNKTIMAQSFGCLCKYDQSYMRGRANRWQHAFGIFYVFPDGYFTYSVIPIFKHRFVVDRKVYQG